MEEESKNVNFVIFTAWKLFFSWIRTAIFHLKDTIDKQ